jgi:FkbM family methyltransferase
MKRINDVWCVPDGDELITRKILESKKPNSDPTHIDLYYERRVREVALSRVTNFGTFVDAGANVGIWSRPMSSLFEKVEAFEPAEKNRECLLINLGKIDNVEIFHHGLGDSNCEGNLHLGVKNCGDCKIIYKKSLKGVLFTEEDVVKVRTLDSHNFHEVGLIKIDTQGHELRIIKGAVETIKKHKPVVVFEIDQDKDQCCEILESLGAKRVPVNNKCNMIYAFKE